MGERVNKVKEMIENHESSLDNLKKEVSKYDIEINKIQLHIDRLTEEKDEYAKDDKILSEEYDKGIKSSEKEKKEVEVEKAKIEKEIASYNENPTRFDKILGQLTQEKMQLDKEIKAVELNMKINLASQENFEYKYDASGKVVNGEDYAKLDKEYKELTDKLYDLKDAKAMCEEYLQKYHEELDNDAKKIQEAIKKDVVEQEEPSQQTPNQQTPSQQTPSQQTPNQQTPSQQTPSQQTSSQTSANKLAENLFSVMNDAQRRNAFMAMLGKEELNEETAKTFEAYEKQYGTDVVEDLKKSVEKMCAQDCLKITGIETDVATGKIKVNFNSGKEFDIDLKEFNTAKNKKIMPSKKAVRKFIENNKISYSENMDPYIIKAIDEATSEQLEEIGIFNDKHINVKKQLNAYREAIEYRGKEDNEKEHVNISYIKSKELTSRGSKRWERTLKPFMRTAKESPYVKIADNIDTRKWYEKIIDMITKSKGNNLLKSGEKVQDTASKAEDTKNADNKKQVVQENKKESKSLQEELKKGAPTQEEQVAQAKARTSNEEKPIQFEELNIDINNEEKEH